MNISEEGVKTLKTVQITGNDNQQTCPDEDLILIKVFAEVIWDNWLKEMKDEETKVLKKES